MLKYISPNSSDLSDIQTQSYARHCLNTMNQTDSSLQNITDFVYSLDLSNRTTNLYKLNRFHLLRELSLHHNRLTHIPRCLSALVHLQKLDLSHNALRHPSGSPLPCSLTQLLVRHNQLKSEDLLHLINPNALSNLKILDISHNDLFYIPLEICSLSSKLTILNLAHNHIRLIPKALMKLMSLVSLNLEGNQIETLPEPELISLRCLFIGKNSLHKNQLNALTHFKHISDLRLNDCLPSNISFPTSLRFLNCRRIDLNGNGLPEIPEFVLFFKEIKIIDLSGNRITTFRIGRGWTRLEAINLSGNKIQSVPIEICDLPRLRRLYLSHNLIKLDGLPLALDRLRSLEHLFLAGNMLETLPLCLARCESLVKIKVNHLLRSPDFLQKFRKRIYRMDVCYERDAPRLGSRRVCPKLNQSLYLNIDFNDEENCANDRIGGSSKIGGGQQPSRRSHRHKPIDHNNKKASSSTSSTFDQIPISGKFSIWRIVNFEPVLVNDFGNYLLSGECYIVLTQDQQSVHYWIGNDASIDKRACVAIHATHLAQTVRQSLKQRCQCKRERQNEESEEFWAIFNEQHVIVIEGNETNSAMVQVSQSHMNEQSLQIFLLTLDGNYQHNKRLLAAYIPLTSNKVDQKMTLRTKENSSLLINTGSELILYNSNNCSALLKSQSRLLANEISSKFREIRSRTELKNTLMSLKIPVMRLDLVRPGSMTIYEVQNDLGKIFISQVKAPFTFQSKSVYLIDLWTEVYVWIGKQSSRYVKIAAQNLVEHVSGCPEGVRVVNVVEGCEDPLLIVRVDLLLKNLRSTFLRLRLGQQTTFSFHQRRSVLSNPHRKLKSDLRVLRSPRPQVIPFDQADEFINDQHDQIKSIGAICIDSQCKSVPVPPESHGIFQSHLCYVYMITYHIPVHVDSSFRLDHGTLSTYERHVVSDERYEDTCSESSVIIYFWQGRRCRTNKIWFHFRTQLLHKIEDLLGRKSKNLQVVRLFQQMESDCFMALFKRKFVLMNNTTYTTTDRCYVVRVRFPSANDIVYVWTGQSVPHEDSFMCQQIAHFIFQAPEHTVQYIAQGNEPEMFFWLALNGPLPIGPPMPSSVRLFRCSNGRGFYQVSEFYPNFCQDCLLDDDVYLLDNGSIVFIWIGPCCTDTELRLAFKSAQVYIRSIGEQREIRFTGKTREPEEFKMCFIGWAEHRKAPVRLERQFPLTFNIDDHVDQPFKYASDRYR
ncbi:hypothetical protein ACOME3_006036 [Neoechinorhynchus agilis]